MDALVLTNLTSTSYTVQGQTIPANGSYKVTSANYLSFAQDAYLQVLVLQGSVDITSYDYDFGASNSQVSPSQWLTLIARGTVVLS